MKEQLSKITSNPIGAAIGGVGTFYLVKKHFHVHHTVALVALAIAGAIAGALVQSHIKAKHSAPTAKTMK